MWRGLISNRGINRRFPGGVAVDCRDREQAIRATRGLVENPERPAIKEVDDGIWLVSFMDYDLGYIDLEEKTLQPLNNPFGPKV